MEIIHDIQTMTERAQALRCSDKTVGFVPTMGALHEGHLSLMRAARKDCDVVVASIYVNPTQFGPNEDLDSYPRQFQEDCALAESVGVDIVFAPDDKAMYPPGFATYVVQEHYTEPLCGRTRPHFFRGVTTVVTKLFNIVDPDRAYFGLKDYQQYVVVRRMVADLNMRVEIIGCPTVREPDGLAMSSRNAYLSEAERRAAPGLYESLCQVRERVSSGVPVTVAEAIELARGHLEDVASSAGAEARIDYVEVRRPESLEPLAHDAVVEAGSAVMLLAVFFGSTRLIDNLAF